LDATHILGKLTFDLDEIAPDFVSFNGDHIHAPKGTGGLWIRSGVRTHPLILGGSEQSGLRAGSVSVALLTALSVAFEEAFAQSDYVCTEVARLRNLLEEGILQGVQGAKSLFRETQRLPTTSLIAIPGVTSDALLYLLSREGLCASFGGGVYQQLSLQLKAMGVDPTLSHCAISLSLSRETSQADVEAAVALIVKTARSLQNLSQSLIV
jgi:cysteine desulfurase